MATPSPRQIMRVPFSLAHAYKRSSVDIYARTIMGGVTICNSRLLAFYMELLLLVGYCFVVEL